MATVAGLAVTVVVGYLGIADNREWVPFSPATTLQVPTTTTEATTVPPTSTSSPTTSEPEPTTTAVQKLWTIGPAQMDSALIPIAHFSEMQSAAWEDWGPTRNTGLIDFDNPDVCGQDIEPELLTYSTFKTGAGAYSGYGGSSLGSFEADGAQQWFDSVVDTSEHCSGVRVTTDTGLTEVDSSVLIQIPGHSDSEWSSDIDEDVDLVVFVKGGMVGMVSGRGADGDGNQSAGTRTLASELTSNIASLPVS